MVLFLNQSQGLFSFFYINICLMHLNHQIHLLFYISIYLILVSYISGFIKVKVYCYLNYSKFNVLKKVCTNLH